MLKIESPRIGVYKSMKRPTDSSLACSRRLKFGMRHKVRAAGKKNKEGEVERGGNLPLLGSTLAVFNFFSHLFVLSTETERLEQAYTAQLTWVMTI